MSAIEAIRTRVSKSRASRRLTPWTWSVRREVWENRSIVVVPFVTAALCPILLLLTLLRHPEWARATMALAPAEPHAVVIPYWATTVILIVVSAITGGIYALDAMQSERKDRSVLFWKSLPVSDRSAVLAKAAIPILVAPSLVVAAAACSDVGILLVTGAVRIAEGRSALELWSRVPIAAILLAQVYVAVISAAWLAPFYALLLFLSGCARRSAALWAILPIVGLTMGESLLFGSDRLKRVLIYATVGWARAGFDHLPAGPTMADPLRLVAPLQLLTTPFLWGGLGSAVLLLALTARMRRVRDPV